MKSTLIATAVLALSAMTGANAFAQGYTIGEATYFAPEVTTSVVTRAEVRADYLKALSAGQVVASYEGAFAPVVQAASNVSRDQIRIEAVMASHGDHFNAM